MLYFQYEFVILLLTYEFKDCPIISSAQSGLSNWLHNLEVPTLIDHDNYLQLIKCYVTYYILFETLSNHQCQPSSVSNAYLHSSLCSLFLSENNIGDDGAICIADLFTSGKFPLLVKLGLNQNSITDIGVCALAKAIDLREHHSCSLEVLGLSSNPGISSIGAAAMGAALTHNSRMLRLFFNNNKGIGNVGILPLVVAAKSHPTLKRLGLSDTGIEGADIAKEILGLLDANSTIERICVCGNSFDPDIEKTMRNCDRLNFRYA